MSGDSSGTPAPTAQERALAERGANEFNRYTTEFAPLAGKLREDIRVTDGERASVKGAAAADMAMATRDPGTGGTGRGSGRAVFSMAGNSVSRGTATGKAQGAAVQAVENNELTGMQKLARTGRNLADNSTLGLSSSARRATREVIAESRADTKRFGERADMAALAGGWAWKKYGPKPTD
jgi:hypothetical protein